jgi:putative ABC transport system permease protein
MAVIAQRLATAYPDADKGWGVAVDRLGDVIVGPQLRTVITVLFAATVFVLLIGCANLANLGLARTISKQGEIAVRYALGAGRWRLTQQLLIEHLVMAACGGIAGIAVGYGLLKWIRRLIPPTVLPPAVDVRIDGSVLFFALTATVATGVLFGVAPAAHAARSRLAVSLGSRGQGAAASSPGRGVRGSLVIAEVALAFVLLVASAVLMRSFFKLLHVDPGFDATNVLTANLPLNQHDHPDPVELVAYLDSIRRAVESVPGVRRTALTSALPLEGWGYGVPYAVAGREPADEGNRRPVFFKIVSPSYFDALGIRLIAGRDLNENDRSGAPRVAVVNETLARREFPDGNAIGRRIVAPEPAAGRTGFGKPLEWEIVGVIADEKINGLGDEFSAGMYVSDVQSPTYTVNLVVKAGVAPESLQKGIRSAIDRVNRNQALAKVRTLAYIADQSRRGSQVVSTLLTVFSAMALLLAAVGIYGVISYMAAQRTQEIGIRAALGASRADLRYLIVRGGMRLALGGLAAGLIVMVPAMDVLSSLLFGVVTYDAPTIASVAAILFAVAGFASYLPAWRATRTDPVEALRHP